MKPYDKPDEVIILLTILSAILTLLQGVPFDTDDAMFHPPASAGVRSSGYEVPIVSYQEPSPVAPDSAAMTPTVVRLYPRS